MSLRTVKGPTDHVVVVGAGLALPGVVDGSGERLLRAPNLGWRDLPPAPACATSSPAYP